MFFDFELSKKSIRRLLVIVVALTMIFSQFAVVGYAYDGSQTYATNESASGDAGEDPVDETPRIIDYYGDELAFYKEDGTAFGMLSPQEGTSAYIKDGMVEITYFPKNKTAYKGFHYGLITDEDLTVDVPLVDEKFEFSVPVDMCGKGIAIAPVKVKDGGTSTNQYYLCIPSEEKINSSEDPGDPSGNAGEDPVEATYSIDEYGHVTWQSDVDVFGCTIGVIDDDTAYIDFGESEIQGIYLQRIINELYSENRIKCASEYIILIGAWDKNGNFLINESFAYQFTPFEYDNNQGDGILELKVGQSVSINLLCNDCSFSGDPEWPGYVMSGDCIMVESVQGADELSVGNSRMFSITAIYPGSTTITFRNRDTGKIYASYDVTVTDSSGSASGNAGDTSGNAGDTSGNAGDISGNAGDVSGNAIESIELTQSSYTVIDNVDGYTTTRYVWDDDTQTESEVEYFYYQTWSAIHTEGNQIIVNGEDVYTCSDGYNPEDDSYERGFYNESGERLYIDLYDNQEGEPWELGGTYPVTVQARGGSHEANYTVYFTVVDNPVKSISTNLTTLSIIEGTNGYIATHYIWDDNTQTSIEDKFYMYQTWEIIKREGTQIIVNGDDVYSYGWGYNSEYDYEDYGFYNANGEWLNYYVSDDQYNNHWEVGGVYTVTINYMGRSCEFQIEIVPSPISSVELIPAETITLMENQGGYMDSVQKYDEDTHEWVTDEFYYYSDYQNNVYTSGSKVIVNGSEEFVFDDSWQNDKPDFINSAGEFLSEKYGDLEISDDQRNVHWTVGSNNYFTVSLLGKSFDCPVTVKENPIKSIEFVPADNLYVYRDDGTQYDWGFEYNFDYYEQVYREGAKVIINGTEEFTYLRHLPEDYTSFVYEFLDKDGKTLSDRYDKESGGVFFYLSVNDDDVELHAQYMGVEGTPITVSVIDSPIASITYTSKDGVDVYEGYIEEADTPWAEGDMLTISYKDGSSKVYTYGYTSVKDHNGYGYIAQAFYNENGCISADKFTPVGDLDPSDWTVPNEYSREFSYQGVVFSIQFNYLKNDIKAIQFEPIDPYILLENTDGSWETSNDGTEYYHYNTPYMFGRTNGNRLTITYEGGEQKVYTYYNNYFRDENGQILKGWIEVYGNQERKPWVVGSDNYCEIAYGGCSCTVPVTILGHDSIESVRLVSGEMIAYRVPGTDRDYYYIDGFNTGDVIEVTYADGTVSRFTYQYHPVGIYEKNFVNEDGVVLNITGQSAIGPNENSWDLFVLGQTISGTFIIKDADVKSVSVKVNHPIYAKDYDYDGFTDADGTEYVSCWWMGRAGDGRDIRPYAIFRQGDTITITDNSGNETVYTFQEDKELYGFYDSEGNELPSRFLSFWDNGNNSWNDPYNENRYWSSDKENEIYVYYLGQKAEEPIKVYLDEQAKISIDQAVVTVEDAVYSGSELEPAVTVTYEGEALTEGVDYTLEYSNNINAGTGEVTVTGIGQYAGDKTVEFTIEPLRVTPELILSATEFTYNGEVQKPEVTVKVNGNEIPAEPAFNGNCIDAGTYTVSVELTGNIIGSNSAQFEILRAEATPEIILSETEFTYNGEAQCPTVSVKVNGKEVPANIYMPTDSVNAGNYSVTVSLTGNYKGDAIAYYTIKPMEVTPEISLTPRFATYNGKEQKPEVTVKVNGNVVDADLEFTGNFTDAGEHYVEATLSGNYVGSASAKMVIGQASMSNCTISGVSENVYYDGKEKTFDITVKFNGMTLTPGKDYTVTYENNVQPGTATVFVTGTGNFMGSASVDFNIIYKPGWNKIDGSWYYFKDDGTATTGWKKISEKWYYFDASGVMQTGLQEISGKWYYFGTSGVMQTGWQDISGSKYYFNTSGVMQTGWQKIDSKWYYFDATGVMQTGLQEISGKTYYFDESGVMQTGWKQIGEDWYYFNASGVMQTGLQEISSKTYYFDENGVMLTGWQEIDGKKCYFNTSGSMATAWKKIDGEWYYFDTTGAMQTGWKKISNKWYYFNDEGVMQSGWQDISNKRYYFNTSGAMQTGWQQIDEEWYYFNDSGAMQTGWKKISDKWYYFHETGVMLTGWQKIDDKDYFFKSSGAMAANEWVKGYWWINKDGTWTYKYKASWKKSGDKWWFGDTSGWYAKNTTITIDGKQYTFDKSGYMV